MMKETSVELSMEEIRNRILRERYEDEEKELSLCRRLRTMCKLAQEETPEVKYSKVFADTYTAEAYVTLGNTEMGIRYGTKAINAAVKMHYQELCLSISNILGYAYGCLDDYENAVRWFCRAYEYASKKNDYSQLGVLSYNIGEIYIKLGDYEEARALYEMGYSLIMQNKDYAEKAHMAPEYHALNMARYYYEIGEYETALEETKKVEHSSYEQESYLLYAMIYAAQNKIVEADRYIMEELKHCSKYKNERKRFDVLQVLYEASMKIQKEELVSKCLHYLYKSANTLKLSNKWVIYYQDAIEAEKKYPAILMEKEEDLLQNYYIWYQKYQDQIDKSTLVCIGNQLELYKVQKRQEVLQKRQEKLNKKSQQDSLTKVYNRMGFETYLPAFLKECRKKQIPFGFCMMDIDYFKECNDQYGHLSGDKCLVVVANVLKEVFSEKKAVVCRFGGDEFIILTQNLSRQELEDCLKKIGSHPALKKVRGVGVTLTISIGAVNCIPQKEDVETQFLYAADKLLYEVKQNGRNGYRYEERL